MHAIFRSIQFSVAHSFWLAAALSAASSLLIAQTEGDTTRGFSPIIRATRAIGQIVIDGLINEKAWNSAPDIVRFVQREPSEGSLVSERTDVRILYDSKNLYFAIRCWDSSTVLIVANEMRRDIYLRNNDCIEIYLDTFHDHRTAFFFSTNPLGAQRDGLITSDLDDTQQNWDWNGVWENVSVLDSAGWTAEIAIPLKTLRFHADSDEPWGLNIARIIPRKREEAYWSPILRDYGFSGYYRISEYGHLADLQNLEHPTKLFLKPYGLAGQTRIVDETPPREEVLEVGLDAKYLITSNLTLDVSFNTDFAQVEADQEQINLTRFELFFPEKREFFLEGAGMFRFGERAWSPLYVPSLFYFSRRIGLSEDNEPVPLFGGVKLTGKMGSSSIGFLNMTADRTSYVTDDSVSVSIPRTNFTVLRVQQDILQNSYVGLMGLNQQSLTDPYFNRGFGADANFFLNQNTQVGGFLAKTSTPGLAGKDLAGYLDFVYNSDFFIAYLSQNSIQDNFNPEMGFFPRTGVRSTHTNIGVGPRPDFLNLRQVFIFDEFIYIAEQSGPLQTRQNNVGAYLSFQDGAYLFAIYQDNYEHITEDFEIHENVTIVPGTYRFGNVLAEFKSDLSKPVAGMLNATIGEFYDGTIRGFAAGADVKLGSRFTTNLLFNQSRVNISAGAFTTNLLSVRALYTFSPRTFIKAFVQWNSEDEAILANVLFNFIHTPGSDLYIVYNDEVFTGGGRPRSEHRAVLVKFTYLFDF